MKKFQSNHSKHIVSWIRSHQFLAIMFGVAFVVSAIGIFVYRYIQLHQQVAALDPDPQKRELQVKKEVEGYVKKISSVMVLPTGMPTVATVVDAEKLKSQPFFAQAMDGDKVLIYTETKRAILYRPSTGKIIDMTSLTDAPALSLTPTPTPLSAYTFAVWNGTRKQGLVKGYESLLKAGVPSATISQTGNAKKQDYPKTILIDMNGDKKETAASIATTLGITVSSFPKDEATPSSKPDFLIILGEDQKNN